MDKTNVEMKKAIIETVKGIDDFEIIVHIWDNDADCLDLIVDVHTMDDYEDFISVNYGEYPLGEDGHKQAIAQAKKLYTYLKRNYENTIINTEILHA